MALGAVDASEARASASHWLLGFTWEEAIRKERDAFIEWHNQILEAIQLLPTASNQPGADGASPFMVILEFLKTAPDELRRLGQVVIARAAELHPRPSPTRTLLERAVNEAVEGIEASVQRILGGGPQGSGG